MLTEKKKEEIINKHWNEILAQIDVCDKSEMIDIHIEENGKVYHYEVYVRVKETKSWHSYQGNSIGGGFYDYDIEHEVEGVELIDVFDAEI